MFSAEAVVHIEKNKREKEYEEIHKSSRSHLKDMLFKDIFLNAMVIGYHNKIHTPLSGSLHDLFRASILNNSEEEWLIKSIAIAEKGNLDQTFCIFKHN